MCSIFIVWRSLHTYRSDASRSVGRRRLPVALFASPLSEDEGKNVVRNSISTSTATFSPARAELQRQLHQPHGFRASEQHFCADFRASPGRTQKALRHAMNRFRVNKLKRPSLCLGRRCEKLSAPVFLRFCIGKSRWK